MSQARSEGALRDTDRDWEEVAKENPYWGVLSADVYKGVQLDEAAGLKFFQSGKQFIDDTVAFIRKHINPGFAPKRSLDFGCGVGRLLLPMARISGAAVGIDVAPSMVEICRNNLHASGIENATVILGDDRLSQVDGVFDFINSYIVIQHIPPERGYEIMALLLSKLEKGGVGSLQLTYAKHRKFLVHETSAAQYYRREGGILFDIGRKQHEPPAGTITMFDYDLNQVVAAVSRIAGSPVLLLPTEDDDHLGAHFVFQRAR
jgi:SAM-dependent methyltransferase